MLTQEGLKLKQEGKGSAADLTAFLRKAYLWVPYHNICHAVMTMLHAQSFVAASTQNNDINAKDKLSLYVGALFHDLGHPGFTNANLAKYQQEENNLIFLEPNGNTCKVIAENGADFK